MAGVPSNIQVVSNGSESEYESVDFNACHKSNSNASLLDLVDSELARRFSSSNPVAADSENNYDAINNKPSILDDCSLVKKAVDTNANEELLNAERDHTDSISIYNNKSNAISQKSIESEKNEINKLRSSSIDRVYDIVRPEDSRLNGQTNGHVIGDRDSDSDDESTHIYENICFSTENEKPEDEQCGSETPSLKPEESGTAHDVKSATCVKSATPKDPENGVGDGAVSPQSPEGDAAESLESHDTVVSVDTFVSPNPVPESSPNFPPSFTSSVSELTFETWTTADDFSHVDEGKDEGVVHVDVDADVNVAAPENTETETDHVHTTDIYDRASPVHDPVFHHFVCPTNLDNDVEQTDETSETLAEKKGKKKKNSLTETTCTTKTKKTKKTKKCEEKENISVKSSFSKFDQLTKKTVLHVRSTDAAEAQNLVQARQNGEDSNKECKQCGKPVFVMEQIKAEGQVWHKNCFRCKTCNKQLTVDTYSSHEGELYCKPHFRELFKPKAVIDDEEPACDKPDLGLEELSSLDVKSRFQVFEKTTAESNDIEKSPSTISVKRSPSILSKLAKFQAKGMDVGVPDDSLNGVPFDQSESSSDEDDESGTVRNSVASERPIKFSAMGDVKKTWEDAGRAQLMEERREERKQERQHLRSHLLMGKQGKMKELYEQAVAESERNAGTGRRDSDLEILKSEKARVMKEKFERGELNNDEDEEDDDETKAKLKDDDLSVFEAGICKKSRSLFLEMDANAVKTQSSQPLSPISPQYQENKKVVTPTNVNRQISDDVVKSSDKVEDVVVETSDISSKFKFFETYKAPEVKRRTFRITPPRDSETKSESPEREMVRDPNVVRADDPVNKEADSALMKSQTTSKMLSIFRQMEEAKDAVPDGPKPLKRFTPPPDYKENDSESEEESEEEEEEEESEEELPNGNIIRASDQIQDEFLQQSRKAAVRARALKEKFEHWEPDKQSVNNAITLLDSDQASIEPTKNLRARFESMKSEQPTIEKSRPRVNRFIPETPPTLCNLCQKKVYQLEKIETDGKIFHKYCFRCTQCHCVLRIESYTFNNGYLYCLPHFKQLFISKGNYDEGFGADPLQKKWAHNHTLSNGTAPIPVVNGSH